MPIALQDLYPADFNHCYGCGQLNTHGLHLRSYILGDEVVCEFMPQPYHTALPGFVYGGLLASLIDCHSMSAAAAAFQQAQGGTIGEGELPRFVTASLKVDYLRPTPLGVTLEVRAHAAEVKARKVVVASTITANGDVCARGEVLAVLMPETMLRK